MTAELLPAFVASRPRIKQPHYADNKPLNKASEPQKSRFVDCVKKEMGKDSPSEVINHDTAEFQPVFMENKPDQLVPRQEIDAEAQGIIQEPTEDDSAAIVLPSFQAQEIQTMIAVNTVSVSSTMITGQVVSLPGENYQADELLVMQSSDSEQLINQANFAAKELINQTNSANPASELLPETRPTISIQTPGQNQPPEIQNNNSLKTGKTEQLPMQLLVDERPANQEKNLVEKQVDVKKLIQMENNRNLSQRVVSINPQSQITVQQEALGKQADTEINNLPGQLTADNNLTNRGNALENTNISTLTAKPDPADVIDQIVKKATIMLKANSSEMRIELKPEFLGKMMIKIVVEDGLVTARFVTENQQVKNLLESNLAALRQSLEAQGIRVERTEVNIGLNNGGLFDGSEGNREWMWNHSGEQTDRGEAYTDSVVMNEMAELEEQLAETTPMDAYGFHENGTMDFII